jgi:hypothetical protein
MRSISQRVNRFIVNAALMGMALGGIFIFGGAPAAQAQDIYGRPALRYDNFRQREAIEHRGYFSPQAEYWRHERREAFEHGWRDRYGRWHR